MNLPARIQENPLAWAADAKALVAKVDDLGTLREMQDQARAVVAYLNGKLGRATEEARAAAEVELRVKRRIGELLPPPMTKADAGRAGGKAEAVAGGDCFGKSQAHKFRKLAEVPAEAFEDYIEEQQAKAKPPSAAGVLRKAELLSRAQPTAYESGCSVGDLHALAERVKAGDVEPFGTVYADPAWRYRDTSTSGSAEDHYQTMSLDEIKALPVGDIAATDAHLHLWTTSPLLPDAFAVMEAWGFDYRSSLIWHKTGRMGLGHYWRIDHELLLLGIRGRCPFGSHAESSVFASQPGRHSAKPDAVRQTLERVSPGPRIEMFARTTTPGWVSWGNQIERTLFNRQAFKEAIA